MSGFKGQAAWLAEHGGESVVAPPVAQPEEPVFTMTIQPGGSSLMADSTYEVARALTKVKDRIEHYHEREGSILDVNGNTIGAWTYRPMDTEEES